MGPKNGNGKDVSSFCHLCQWNTAPSNRRHSIYLRNYHIQFVEFVGLCRKYLVEHGRKGLHLALNIAFTDNGFTTQFQKNQVLQENEPLKHLV